MEQRFEFSGAEVQVLLAESHAAEERLFTEAQRYVAAGVDLDSAGDDWDADADHPETGAPPGLWLMNDRGVYLQSNAADAAGDRVAYARGYRADIQIGDEPIWEFIDAAPLSALRAEDTLVVTLSEQKVRLSLLRDD